MAQLIETLRLNPEGSGSESRWCRCHNPSGRNMVLGSIQPLTEMSTRDISWGVKEALRKADNLTIFRCRLSTNSADLNLLEPSGPVQAHNEIALLL